LTSETRVRLLCPPAFDGQIRKAVAMKTATLCLLALFPAGIDLANKREHCEHAPQSTCSNNHAASG
jgi:hypothetical protein